MKERKSTIKEDLDEIKIVIEIMKKQIAQLEQKLGLVTIRTPLFTEEDLKEMANMKKVHQLIQEYNNDYTTKYS